MRRIIVILLIFGVTSMVKAIRVVHSVDPIYVNHNTSSVTILPSQESLGGRLGTALGQCIAGWIRKYQRAKEIRRAHQRQIKLENYCQEQLRQQRLRDQAHQKRLQEIAHQQRLKELARQKQLQEELDHQQHLQEQALRKHLEKERGENMMFAFLLAVLLVATVLYVFLASRGQRGKNIE